MSWQLALPARCDFLAGRHGSAGPASDFFPKANFEAAMKTIPDGAPVIFAFGEIDCREGLLLAVERARYPDLEAGIRTVVEIYVTRLKELAQRFGQPQALAQPHAGEQGQRRRRAQDAVPA